MKTQKVFLISLALLLSISIFAQTTEKYVSEKSHIKFFSTTPVEDIEAHNYASVSTINTVTGDIVFSVPMQSFEFEKSLMQKHFNQEKFLDTKQFPKSKLKAKITNLGDVDFRKNGTYNATVEGELTIKGETNPLSAVGTITVKDDGASITVNSIFSIVLEDYNVSFEGDQKLAPRIAKEVEITVVADYKPKV